MEGFKNYVGIHTGWKKFIRHLTTQKKSPWSYFGNHRVNSLVYGYENFKRVSFGNVDMRM
jgi:hypothetical protein